MTGSCIAHYRITGKLGEGGMGAVYRAHDMKLGRDVAIKVLPPTLANDADYIARFEREAQVLASLNHPNIAAIYGLEENAIVMELVEGTEPKGPLPVDEVVNIGKQIADALEAAHERGIIHRDLKPANIKITADGTVKVLDFGLAKATEPTKAVSVSMANSPTLTIHATTAGMMLGTAAYMSPEQAAGKPVDRRADIWAFGVVLWEMIAGRQLFDGETISHTLAAVLKDTIDFSPIPEGPVRTLVERCLQRDPKQRLPWIGEARFALNAPVAAPKAATKTGWLAPAVAALATAVVLAGAGWTLWPVPAIPRTIEFEITGPGDTRATSGSLSPDGRTLAFIASARGYGDGRILLRTLDSAEARVLAGTEGATTVSWSPDGKHVLFIAAGQLKTTAVDAGRVQTIAPDAFGLGVWLSSGWILFTRASTRVLHKVRADGGIAEPALPLDKDRGEVGHSNPAGVDGQRFLYTSIGSKGPGVYLGSLAGTGSRRILPGSQGAVYTPAQNGSGGYLVYRRQEHLHARRFDARSGEEGEDFLLVSNSNTLSASPHGLIYVPLTDRSSAIKWVDGSGTAGLPIGDLGGVGSVRLSPDDRRAAVTIGGDIWVADLDRGSKSRLTYGEARYTHPVWSPDGRQIAYGVEGKTHTMELRDASGGGKPAVLLESKLPVRPMDWSPDGSWLLYMTGFRGRWDVYILPLKGDRKPVPVLVDLFDKYASRISPDGKWIAYCSEETAQMQVYVTPVPAAVAGGQTLTGRWTVSTTGGSHPAWRADGKALYFYGDRSIMYVPIQTSERGVSAGVPERLIGGIPPPGGPPYQYGVSKDGKRFLLVDRIEDTDRPLMLRLNWQSKLRK